MAFVLPPISQGHLLASSSLLSSSSGGDDLFDSSDVHSPAHSDTHPPTHSDSLCLSHCPQICCQHQSYMSFLAFKTIKKIGLTRMVILKLRNLTCTFVVSFCWFCFDRMSFPRSPARKNKWLEELCERFGLAHSGNKTTRHERLVKFSQARMEHWKAKYIYSCHTQMNTHLPLLSQASPSDVSSSQGSESGEGWRYHKEEAGISSKPHP